MLTFEKWIKDQGGPTQVAEKLKVSSRVVNYWLTGERAPNINSLLRIEPLVRGKLTMAQIVKECRMRGKERQ